MTTLRQSWCIDNLSRKTFSKGSSLKHLIDKGLQYLRNLLNSLTTHSRNSCSPFRRDRYCLVLWSSLSLVVVKYLNYCFISFTLLFSQRMHSITLKKEPFIKLSIFKRKQLLWWPLQFGVSLLSRSNFLSMHSSSQHCQLMFNGAAKESSSSSSFHVLGLPSY